MFWFSKRSLMSSPTIYKTPGNYLLSWLVFHIFFVNLWEDYHHKMEYGYGQTGNRYSTNYGFAILMMVL